jgi:hypothetical protein
VRTEEFNAGDVGYVPILLQKVVDGLCGG